mmetsp:Transcript_7198/g.19578  ORF Transcript_7198/g.19578 Transcript_7198/m.19578 type:complete len:290 (+) Transcript_7198:312-1181(+)
MSDSPRRAKAPPLPPPPRPLEAPPAGLERCLDELPPTLDQPALALARACCCACAFFCAACAAALAGAKRAATSSWSSNQPRWAAMTSRILSWSSGIWPTWRACSIERSLLSALARASMLRSARIWRYAVATSDSASAGARGSMALALSAASWSSWSCLAVTSSLSARLSLPWERAVAISTCTASSLAAVDLTTSPRSGPVSWPDLTRSAMAFCNHARRSWSASAEHTALQPSSAGESGCALTSLSSMLLKRGRYTAWSSRRHLWRCAYAGRCASASATKASSESAARSW